MQQFNYSLLTNTLATLTFFTILILMASCEKDSGPIVIKPDAPANTIDTTISFSEIIQPLFNIHCIQCHNNTHPFLDLRESFAYDELVQNGENAPYVDSIQPEESYLAARLYGVEWPIMPPDPPHFTASEIDTIIQWMQEGFKNN